MAIYHLAHSHIGKSTQKQAHTASAHADYITRPNSAREVLAAHMPKEWQGAMAWLRSAEDGDRTNARIIDKVEIALPKELTHEQNAELVRAFCEGMTGNRVPWLAAMHDGAENVDNPHAHIIFRDRDIETGRRVMMTTELGSTERFREAWERHANQALERAGHDARIDRRTLEAQGIEREAQIHVGPKGAILQAKGLVPVSEIVVDPRWAKSTEGKPEIREAQINYPAIDQGRTRADYNAEIIARNAAREIEAAPRLLTLRERNEQYWASMPERMREADAKLQAEQQPPVTEQAPDQEKKRAPADNTRTSWAGAAGMAAQQRSAMEHTDAGRARKKERQEGKQEHRNARRAEAYFVQRIEAAREGATPLPQPEVRRAETPFAKLPMGSAGLERPTIEVAPDPAIARQKAADHAHETRPERAIISPARETTDRRAETKDAARSVSDLDIERARFAAALDRSLARQKGESERERDGGRER